MDSNGYSGIFVKSDNFPAVVEGLRKFLPVGKAFLIPPINSWIGIYEERHSLTYNVNDADFIAGLCSELSTDCIAISYHPEYGFSLKYYFLGETAFVFNSLFKSGVNLKEIDLHYLYPLVYQRITENGETLDTILNSKKYDEEGMCSRCSDLYGIENFYTSYQQILKDKQFLFRGKEIFEYFDGTLYKDNILTEDLNKTNNIISCEREIYIWALNEKRFDLTEFKALFSNIFESKKYVIIERDNNVYININENNFIEIVCHDNIPLEIIQIFNKISPSLQVVGRLKNVKCRYSINVSLGAGRETLILQRVCAYLVARLSDGIIDDFDSFFEPSEYLSLIHI